MPSPQVMITCAHYRECVNSGLAWSENILDGTLKRLRELSGTGERPFFSCLERSLSTTTKWNLRHFLGNHFNAF